MSHRWIQEDILGGGDAGDGGSVDVQHRSADEEIFRLPDQRQTGRRSSAAVDVPFSHRLQHESSQKLGVGCRSKRRGEAQKKASYRYCLST